MHQDDDDRKDQGAIAPDQRAHLTLVGGSSRRPRSKRLHRDPQTAKVRDASEEKDLR